MIALVIALPNVIWQIRNGMPVIHHMKELAATQLVNVDRMGFLEDQLVFFMLGSMIIIAALVAFVVYRPFRPYRLIGWTCIFVMLLFLYLQAKSYYTLGLYPVLLAFGSVFWERLFLQGRARYMRVAWLLLIAAPFVLLFRVIFPVLPPEKVQQEFIKHSYLPGLRWEDGKIHPMPQDFADMLGWREMAALALQAYEQVPDSDRDKTLIFCDNYGQAGAVSYYNSGRKLPVASFNADYLFWLPAKDTLHYLIIVGQEPDEYARKYTSGFVKTGQVRNPLAREYGTGIYLMPVVSPLLPGKLREWQQEKQRELRAW